MKKPALATGLLALGTVAWAVGATTNFCATQGWYDLTGAVDPTNPGKLFVAGLDTYLEFYNYDRVHHGRLTRGRIPADIVYGARKMEAR